MSAHRALNDLFRAFDTAVGPGNLNDPGDAGTITVGMWGQICSVVTEGASETRILAQATKPGVLCAVVHDTDGGDFDLTVTGGYNRDNETGINFADAKDYVVFYSIKAGTSYYWRAIAQEGTDAAVEEGAFDALTATAATIATLTVEDVEVAAETAEHGSGAAHPWASALTTTRYTVNGEIITTIKLDMTGLRSKDDADDIIGHATNGASYLGRNVVATNGIIYRIDMSCLETPAGGDDDINFVSGSAGDQEFDFAVTNAAVEINGGDWVAGKSVVQDSPSVTANYYFYLTCGTGDIVANYTAGMFIIRLYGHALLA